MNEFFYQNFFEYLPKISREELSSISKICPAPHDTRHTCISMLVSAGVDDRVVKKIVEHKGQGVTQTIYTHFEIDELLDAINRI